MYFKVISTQIPNGAKNCAFLTTDNWDDWRKYRTAFYLTVVDGEGKQYPIGTVKIGQVGLKPGHTVEPGQRAPEIPQEFDTLSDAFFSLGQGEDYYATLSQLGAEISASILTALKDVAFDLSIFERNLSEDVMGESLLRSIHANNVRHRLHRLTRGDAELTVFRFQYTLPQSGETLPPLMQFEVTPYSEPPTNVHVLIGRNGVGKTKCMRDMVEALLGRTRTDPKAGQITLLHDGFSSWSFAGLILISFSAFDDFDLRPRQSDIMASEQVGLRHKIEVDGEGAGRIKSPSDLAIDFRISLGRCRVGLKAQRWVSAIRTLETDDLFAEADITSLLGLAKDENWDEKVEDLFKRLSSGHAIILLTITRLVELVDEKTLILLDEPEGHLHPPLLSAFVRCLSDLLVQRNAVAIIATHSPVVLQEVPQSCAWKLRRSRATSVVERPTIETFGENIGVLTREVFGFEVTRSGFHQLLSKSVESGLDYHSILQKFNGQLGAEAQSIVQALIANRDR